MEDNASKQVWTITYIAPAYNCVLFEEVSIKENNPSESGMDLHSLGVTDTATGRLCSARYMTWKSHRSFLLQIMKGALESPGFCLYGRRGT